MVALGKEIENDSCEGDRAGVEDRECNGFSDGDKKNKPHSAVIQIESRKKDGTHNKYQEFVVWQWLRGKITCECSIQ